jgi:hypothetical protein
MKKIIGYLIIISFLVCSPIFMSSVLADLPPDPGGGPGGGDLPVGGGSPIGSGLVILMTLGAAYGSKKIFDARKKILD